MIAYVGVVASGGLTVSLKAQVKYQSVTSNAQNKCSDLKKAVTKEIECRRNKVHMCGDNWKQ